MKNNKGITMTSLIVTIIVMVILAGIALLFSVGEEGIIKRSQQTVLVQQLAKEEEAVDLAIDDAKLITFGSDLTGEALTEGLKNQNLEPDRKLTKTAPFMFKIKGGTEKIYTVTASGEVINGWYDNGDGSYTKGDITVKIGETIYTNEEVQKKLGVTGGSYKGTWTVIGVEGEKIKLVSTSNVTEQYVDLGEKDPNVFKKDENGNQTTILKEEIVEIFDKEGQEETNLNLEKAIWSYQHIVETLDNCAKKATGISNARSITIEDLEAKDVLNITNNKKIELSPNYGKTFNYFYNTEQSKVSSKNKALGSNNWSNISTSPFTSEIFVDKKGKIVLVDSKDDEVTLDYNYYIYTDAFANTKFADFLGASRYWLASPCVECYTNNAEFFIRIVDAGGIKRREVFYSHGSLVNTGYTGVRAIIYI